MLDKLKALLPTLSLSAPKLMWFKAESAAFAAAITQFVFVWFGADISWLQGIVTTLATWAAAYATVKPVE